MGQTDKQFGGFLRILISQIKRALAENDLEAKNEMLRNILTDLQNTLED